MQSPPGSQQTRPQPGFPRPQLITQTIPTRSHRLSFHTAEPPQPLEPSSSLHTGPPTAYPGRTSNDNERHRLQLPGLHELLSPVSRPSPSSPLSWPPQSSDLSVDPSQRSASGYPFPSASASHYANGQPLGSADTRQRDTFGPPPLTSPHAAPYVPQHRPPHPDLNGSNGQLHPGYGTHYMMPPYPAYNPDSMYSDVRRDSAFPASSGTITTSECVGQRQIAGRGLCYIYKDGSVVPTVIDGEAVNPVWGTTKAGKARKRLAQACLACREKKIRCEPRHPKCVQCAKSKRECIMPPMTALQQVDMAESSSSTHQRSSLSNVIYASPGNINSVASFGSARARQSPSPKRRRSMSHFRTQNMRSALDASSREAGAAPAVGTSSREAADSAGHDDLSMSDSSQGGALSENDDDKSATPVVSCLGWDLSNDYADPHDISAEQTLDLLDGFFDFQRAIGLNIFLKRAVVYWAEKCSNKSPHGRALLDSMLALGGVINGRVSPFADSCADRALRFHSLSIGKFSLALVQIRLFLAWYHFFKNNEGVAWDLTGAASRTASALGVHTESGCLNAAQEVAAWRGHIETNSVPLVPQFTECSRRTFWALFAFETRQLCLSYSQQDTIRAYRSGDIHLRLPMNDILYQMDLDSSGQFFHTLSLSPTLRGGKGSAAEMHDYIHMIMASQQWADVVAFVYPAINHTDADYVHRYETFLQEAMRRSTQWVSNLPQHLAFDSTSLDDHSKAGTLTWFVYMHMQHTMCVLEATVFVHHTALTREAACRNIRLAQMQARQILSMVGAIASIEHDPAVHHPAFSVLTKPFLEYATAAAIDTVTVGGHLNQVGSVIKHITAARNILALVNPQSDTRGGGPTPVAAILGRVDKRIVQLQDIESTTHRPDTIVDRESDTWRITLPMEPSFQPHYHVVYGVSSPILFEALRGV